MIELKDILKASIETIGRLGVVFLLWFCYYAIGFNIVIKNYFWVIVFVVTVLWSILPFILYWADYIYEIRLTNKLAKNG